MSHVIKPSSGQHWDVLDGLRGVAILMVVACHGFYTNPNGPEWLLWVGDFIGAGGLGVQMFFVISGFLISYPFLKARQRDRSQWHQPGYATRRFLKILPPYLLCILLFSMLYTVRDKNLTMLKTGLMWLVGIPHLFYAKEAFEFNGSFWSLWVEIGFYLLLPVFFWSTRGRSVGFSTITISSLLLFGSLLVSYLTWPESPPPGYYLLYFGARFPNGLATFAWGVLFAGLFVTLRDRPAGFPHGRKLGNAGMLLLLIAFLWQMTAVRTGMTREWFALLLKSLLPGAATFLLLFFLCDTNAVGAKLLSCSWLKYIGVVSYEWFLLHQPILLHFRHNSGGAKGSLMEYLLIVLTPMVLTLIAAGLIYRFCSAPIIEWGRARLARGRNAEARQIQAG